MLSTLLCVIINWQSNKCISYSYHMGYARFNVWFSRSTNSGIQSISTSTWSTLWYLNRKQLKKCMLLTGIAKLSPSFSLGWVGYITRFSSQPQTHPPIKVCSAHYWVQISKVKLVLSLSKVQKNNKTLTLVVYYPCLTLFLI